MTPIPPRPTVFLLALGLAGCVLTLGAEPGTTPFPKPSFRRVVLDADVAIGYGVAVADMDGDGRPDILLCDKNRLVWYRNPDWKASVLAENLTRLDHVCIAAVRVPGEPHTRVAAGAGWNPSDTRTSGALFHLQPGTDPSAAWTAHPLPHDPTIHRIRWALDPRNQWSLVSVPLHGIGNDPGPGEGAGVRVQRYVPPSASSPVTGPWTTEILNADHHKTHNFEPVTWPGFPGHSILLAAREGAFLIHADPDADVGPGGRTAYRSIRLGSDENGGFGEIRMGSLGTGRRMIAGISPMHGNEVVVLLPPEDVTPDGWLTRPWTRRVLDDSLIDGHALGVGDLLGIGRDQVVAGWRAMGRPQVPVGIRMYIPTDASGTNWETVLIDDNGMACEDLCLADIDGDGRLDIVAAGRATRNLVLYLNETAAP